MALPAIAAVAGPVLSTYLNSMTAEEGLEQQKIMFDAMMRMAQAARQDAFGNEVRYDDALNKWITDLTPTQKGIARAGEREQFQSLTHDAMQNRDIRDDARRRGINAGEDYNNAIAGYRYDRAPSEGSINDEITRLLTNATGSGEAFANNLLSRQGIRQRGKVPSVSSGTGAEGVGRKLAELMLQARGASLGETGQRQGIKDNAYLPAIDRFSKLMDQGQSGGIQLPNFNNLFDAQNQGNTQANNAYRTAAPAMGNAYNALIKAQTPDFAAMARLMAGGPAGAAGGAAAGAAGVGSFDAMGNLAAGGGLSPVRPYYDPTRAGAFY